MLQIQQGKILLTAILQIRIFLLTKMLIPFPPHMLPSVSTIRIQTEYRTTDFLCKFENATQRCSYGNFFHTYVTDIHNGCELCL